MNCTKKTDMDNLVTNTQKPFYFVFFGVIINRYCGYNKYNLRGNIL